LFLIYVNWNPMNHLITQQQLSDNLTISKHLSRIINRQSFQAKVANFDAFDPVAISDILFNRLELISAISRDLKSGDYTLGAAKRKLIRVDKWRILYEFDLIDRVVMGVMAEALNSKLGKLLVPNIHSFVPGRSNLKAVDKASKFVRRQYLGAKTPGERELIVWRFDVKNYTDSIPVGDLSLLWSELRRVVERTFDCPQWAFQIFKQGLRPIINDHKNVPDLLNKLSEPVSLLNGPAMNTIGVTTGTAFGPIAANLYLREFDDWLSRQAGFYARYGDDVLYIDKRSPSAEDVIEKGRKIIAKLELHSNLKKEKMILLTGRGPVNGCGQKSSLSSINLEPLQQFEFLGWRINHRGDLQPNSEKIRREIAVIKRRAYNTFSVVGDRKGLQDNHFSTEWQNNFRMVVQIVSQLRNQNSCGDVNFTNRHVLRRLSKSLQKNLDRYFAQFLSSHWTGVKGPRTFRRMTWNILINRFGLQNIQGRFGRSKSRSARKDVD